MSSNKYKLSKLADGEKKVCAFYLSVKGCKNGANCKFLHGTDSDPLTSKKKPAVLSDSSSTVSSESEDGRDDVLFETPGKFTAEQKVQLTYTQPPPSEESKNAKKRKNRSNSDGNIFSNPKPKRNDAPNSSNSKKMESTIGEPAQVERCSIFSRMADVACVVAPKTSMTPQIPPNEPPKKKQKQKNKSLDSTPPPVAKAATPSFRTLDLPIASFASENNIKPQTTPSSTPRNASMTSDVSADEPVHPQYPLPHSTPEGIKWQKACLQTRANPRYESDFNFEKYKKADAESGRGDPTMSWIKARPFGAWCAKNPHAIAIDCEMCETKDPVSGVSDHKALCRLSVVNAMDASDVLIDTLVKPAWPVVDYRSRINGIKQEDLDSVQFTLRHAQAFMMALCSEETVIIGHAVHNDLVALKMEHHCNADSALLFTVKDEPGATCSLKDLAMGVLQREMPEIHDSVNDAKVALLCLEEGYVKKDGNTEEIVRSTPIRNRQNRRGELFVHRIPRICKEDHIRKMFLSHTSIQPTEVPKIEFGSSTGKSTVSFPSVEHANLAFASLTGVEQPDKTGRLQKKVYLRDKSYIFVRHMTMTKSSKVRKSD